MKEIIFSGLDKNILVEDNIRYLICGSTDNRSTIERFLEINQVDLNEKSDINSYLKIFKEYELPMNYFCLPPLETSMGGVLYTSFYQYDKNPIITSYFQNLCEAITLYNMGHFEVFNNEFLPCLKLPFQIDDFEDDNLALDLGAIYGLLKDKFSINDLLGISKVLDKRYNFYEEKHHYLNIDKPNLTNALTFLMENRINLQ